MTSIHHYLESSLEMKKILNEIKKDTREFSITGCKGSLEALLSSIIINHTTFPQIILTRDNAELNKFAEDLFYYSGQKNILKFPGPEIFIENNYSFDDESRQLRYQTLCSIYQDNKQIIITTPEAINSPVPQIEELLSYNILLHTGMNLNPDDLIRFCFKSGYEEENIIDHRGTFSRRGGIVDIFPLGALNPVRVEFFEDEISSLRLFDIETQRSISKINDIEIHPFHEPPAKKLISDYILPGSTVFLCNMDSKKIDLYENTKSLIKPKFFIEFNHLFQDINHKYKKNFPFLCRSIDSAKFNLDAFISKLKEYKKNNFLVFILCDNKGQKDRFIEILEENEAPIGHISIQVGKISSGFEFADANLVIIKDDEIFGRYEVRKKYPHFRSKKGLNITSYLELSEMDYIVHIYHGIGKYLGIERLKIEEKEEDFIKIMYEGNDKIYVPISQLNLVQKYIGDVDPPPALNSLRSTAWIRSKEKVKKEVEKIAKELLEINATRQLVPGYNFKPDTPWQQEFENSFIYEETHDQLNAITEVKEDMEKNKPMDRLICGDVGYGKTEVAVRAGFKAVMDTKQVAVLVPTTILAQQHFKTFSDRMADYPITIEMLSRFRNRKEQKLIIESLIQGKIDIIIGTHRLLQKDIEFKNLGLLVIDEEHRFGVYHKEKIKKIRKLVDVLSLTATPIPRTLQMSLLEVRDMSMINTPPTGRVPIKTFVMEFNQDMIKEAILRELEREGQIFFVHNEVRNIEGTSLFLQDLIPNLKVAIAHGQMAENELEKTMIDFSERKYDVLVCTTIIESGLDIPNVNTIIIEKADKFGLAQLYQLKGRVGRCDRMAYAYLFYDNPHELTHTAHKRLEAIAEITELGSGFKIAMRDLEIRGAGNILGTAQHGHINAVGYDLYCELLKESIEKLKGKPHKEIKEPEINLKISTFFPDDYVPDSKQKISLYKRLSGLQSIFEVEDLEKELIDRYGNIPLPVINLLNIIRIKILTIKCGIIKIYEANNKIFVKFDEKNKLKPEKIAIILKQFAEKISFLASSTPMLTINTNHIKIESEKIELVKKVLHILE